MVDGSPRRSRRIRRPMNASRRARCSLSIEESSRPPFRSYRPREATLVHPAEAGVLSLPLFPRSRPEENVVSAVEWSGLSIAATGVVETAAFGDEAPPPARHFVTVSLRIENKLEKSQTLVLSDFVEARSTPSTAARPISLHSTLGQGSTLFPGVPVTGTLVFEVDDGASLVALTLTMVRHARNFRLSSILR